MYDLLEWKDTAGSVFLCASGLKRCILIAGSANPAVYDEDHNTIVTSRMLCVEAGLHYGFVTELASEKPPVPAIAHSTV